MATKQKPLSAGKRAKLEKKRGKLEKKLREIDALLSAPVKAEPARKRKPAKKKAGRSTGKKEKSA